MSLSKGEEQLMNYLWELKTAFMKDLLAEFPDPKPATTTILTLLKRMKDKGYVGYELFGNSRQYHPIVSKSDYFSRHLKGLIKDFFNNSSTQFASFFTNEADMTQDELEDLRKMIDEKIDKKND